MDPEIADVELKCNVVVAELYNDNANFEKLLSTAQLDKLSFIRN